MAISISLYHAVKCYSVLRFGFFPEKENRDEVVTPMLFDYRRMRNHSRMCPENDEKSHRGNTGEEIRGGGREDRAQVAIYACPTNERARRASRGMDARARARRRSRPRLRFGLGSRPATIDSRQTVRADSLLRPHGDRKNLRSCCSNNPVPVGQTRNVRRPEE